MASEPSAPDKRRTTRVGAPKVVVRIPSADRFRSHYVKDLSEGGLFIRAEKVLPIGAELTVELWPPGENFPLSLAARVVRTVDAASATALNPAGLAVSFVDMTVEAEARLRGLIESHGRALAESESDDPLSQVQRMVAELEEARGQVSMVATELADARGQLEAYSDQIRSLEAEEQAAQRELQAQTIARNQLEQEVRKLRSESVDLRKRLEAAERTTSDLNAARTEIQELRKQLEVERSSGEVATLRQRLGEMSIAVESARAKERDLGKLLSGAMKSGPGKAARPGSTPLAPQPPSAQPPPEEVLVEESWSGLQSFPAPPPAAPAPPMPFDRPAEKAPAVAPAPAKFATDSIDLAFDALQVNDDPSEESPPEEEPADGSEVVLFDTTPEPVRFSELTPVMPPPTPLTAALKAVAPAPKPSPPLAIPGVTADDLDSFLGGDETTAVGGPESQDVAEDPNDEPVGGLAGFVLETSIVDGRVGYEQFSKKLKLNTRLMPSDDMPSRKPNSVDEALLAELVAAAPTFSTLLNQIGGQVKEERLKQLLYEMYARALIDLREY